MSDGTSSTHLLLGGLALFLVVAAVALLWAYGKCIGCYKWNNQAWKGPKPSCDTLGGTICGKSKKGGSCVKCPAQCNKVVTDPGRPTGCSTEGKSN